MHFSRKSPENGIRRGATFGLRRNTTMKKFLMSGAMALMITAMASVAHATKMELAPGEYCGTWEANDTVWGSISGGQYVFVKWTDRSTTGDGLTRESYASSLFIPAGGDLSYNESNQIGVDDADGQYGNGWYVFRAPYTGNYVLEHQDSGENVDSSYVKVCFFNYLVDEPALERN